MMRENWKPCVEVESSYGTREVSLYTRQLMNRNIFIQGEINADIANDVLNQIMFLTKESDAEINLFINSGGGEVASGLVIYDLLQEIKIPINIYCTGMAASMAAVLLAAGQKGRRYILPHSKTMIHEPLIAGGVGGSATSIKTISNSILETKDIVNTILAKHTGKSVDEINEATAFDNYMNAEESVAFGLCDAIKGPL
ncbi:MAG TPA: ATP-dependent Clp protease proteolytic subunit [Lachnospiraceae bacterium]|nr:ATP-dependent Clp protease proteolytic subunit [Lachnospiraceae bacterium]